MQKVRMAESNSKESPDQCRLNLRDQSFPIAEGVESRFVFQNCPVCGEKGFIEYLKYPKGTKHFCPRCGRFILDDYVAYVVFERNLAYSASVFFNLLQRKQANRYYTNDCKIQVLVENKTNFTKVYSSEEYEMVLSSDLQKSGKELEDPDILLQRIIENISILLNCDRTAEFFISPNISKLVQVVFYLKGENFVSELQTNLTDLIDGGTIELSRKTDEGSYYKITKLGVQKAGGIIEATQHSTSQQIHIAGDYFEGDQINGEKIHFENSDIVSSNVIVGGSSNCQSINHTSPIKGNLFYGIWQNLIASGIWWLFFGGGIVAFIAYWDNIIRIFK